MFPDFSQTLSKDRHFLQSAFKNPNKYGGLSKVEEKLFAAKPVRAKPRSCPRFVWNSGAGRRV